MQTAKPHLELLTSEAAYRHNPTALFHQVCGARPATLLLESADIDSKDDLKSLLLVDSALRITALGDTVTIKALSDNGAALLPLLDASLPAGIENEHHPEMRVLHFPPVSQLLDEDARLCSLSVFDAFRLLQNLVTVPEDEREAMFFGGLFAYDLVAGFGELLVRGRELLGPVTGGVPGAVLQRQVRGTGHHEQYLRHLRSLLSSRARGSRTHREIAMPSTLPRAAIGRTRGTPWSASLATAPRPSARSPPRCW